MSTRKEKTGWRRYLIFVLPFAGVAMVFLYLSVFNLFRYWNIAQTGTKPNEIKESFIKPLGVLRCVFEAPPLSPNPCGTLNGAITAKAVVVWGYATGLVAVALLFSALLAGYVVWHGPGRGARSDAARWTKRKRWLLTACVLLFSLLIYPLASHGAGFFAQYSIVSGQIWELIAAQFHEQDRFVNFYGIELLAFALSYGVSLALVFASAATLWPLRRAESHNAFWKQRDVEEAASNVAMQMKHLRWVLYMGAILLVLVIFRHKTTMNWALEYVKPLSLLKKEVLDSASVLFANFESMIANNLMATSVFNTLLLAGIYVPSAMVLQRRADRLSKLAVKLESKQAAETQKEGEKKAALTAATLKTRQQEWIKNYGLTHPLKEQMPKAIAILSPLLAGPIGELLNFFK